MPRQCTFDTESFRGVWGYCAVIDMCEYRWSGYRIPDPAEVPLLDAYLAAMSRGLDLGSRPSLRIFTEGALSWLAGELAEGTARHVNRAAYVPEEPAVDLLAAALACICGERFFLVNLERCRATQAATAAVEAVAVTSAEDARDTILRHPAVLTLEAEGLRREALEAPALAADPDRGLFTCERLQGLPH
jgi:hypothetical protein